MTQGLRGRDRESCAPSFSSGRFPLSEGLESVPVRQGLTSRKSQGRSGRPAIPNEHIDFIRRISSDHPEYGEDRIALELEVKFGIRQACSTVRRYMVKRHPGPRDSQAWRSFLKDQAKAMWCCDFFVQHTVGFRVLCIFVIMEAASRKVIHLHVTDHPTLEWTKQRDPECLLRGGAQVPAARQRQEVRSTRSSVSSGEGREDVVSNPHTMRGSGRRWASGGGIASPYGAPNAAAHTERLIGTLRRECLDRMLIWNERHLRCLLREFIGWYNHGRVHQGLNGIPDPDPAIDGPKPSGGRLVAIPVLNGLHHDYRLAA